MGFLAGASHNSTTRYLILSTQIDRCQLLESARYFQQNPKKSFVRGITFEKEGVGLDEEMSEGLFVSTFLIREPLNKWRLRGSGEPVLSEVERVSPRFNNPP